MRSQESLTHKMKKAIYPGSFDPMTLGHLDIIERSSRIVDELNVAVLKNNAKNPLFSADERVSMIKEFKSLLYRFMLNLLYTLSTSSFGTNFDISPP